MTIEQTCKITLTPKEVREALTEYIRDHNRYRNNFRRYDEVLSYHMLEEENGPITVLWGEALAAEEEDAETAAIRAVRAEAASAAAPACGHITESATPSEPTLLK